MSSRKSKKVYPGCLLYGLVFRRARVRRAYLWLVWRCIKGFRGGEIWRLIEAAWGVEQSNKFALFEGAV